MKPVSFFFIFFSFSLLSSDFSSDFLGCTFSALKVGINKIPSLFISAKSFIINPFSISLFTLGTLYSIKEHRNKKIPLLRAIQQIKEYTQQEEAIKISNNLIKKGGFCLRDYLMNYAAKYRLGEAGPNALVDKINKLTIPEIRNILFPVNVNIGRCDLIRNTKPPLYLLDGDMESIYTCITHSIISDLRRERERMFIDYYNIKETLYFLFKKLPAISECCLIIALGLLLKKNNLFLKKISLFI